MLHLRAKDNPFDHLEELLARLERLDAGDQDDIADAVRDGYAQNFANESNGDGQGWAPLAESTVKQRGSAHPILVRTGLGKDSFIKKNAADHIQNFITRAGGWTLEVGSESEIMNLHKTGTSRMPARVMDELSAKAEEKIERRIDSVIERIEWQILGG